MSLFSIVKCPPSTANPLRSKPYGRVVDVSPRLAAWSDLTKHTIMKRNKSLIEGIEFDLVYFHRQRIARRSGFQMQMLRDARDAPLVNGSRVDMLRSALVETKRNEFNTALTVEEVIEPLRVGVDIRAILQADAYMADPAHQRFV